MDDSEHQPLESLDDWEDDLLRRYPKEQMPGHEANRDISESFEAVEALSPAKETAKFRDYQAQVRPCVQEFYRLNHRYQTFDFVQEKRAQYLTLSQSRMSIWEAMEYLNQLVDDSDPDIDLPQIEHLLQTAEAIRADKRPDWFILAGLIHDLGKILCLFGEPQWAVVGDTFPVGCEFSDKIVFHEAFEQNPDLNHEIYSTRLGVYTEGCGLDKVILSWGHDEYLYHVVKDYLPEPALAMIRYHSCYPIHREGAYEHLLQAGDSALLDWVRDFNQYDLYTKRDERMDVASLRPYYETLITKYFPPVLNW